MIDIKRYFAYNHLPTHLQQTSKPFSELLSQMEHIPDSEEKEAGIRKLLEAKDCFVRASLL